VLFVTAALFLTNLTVETNWDSDGRWGEGMLDFVWASSSVTASWDSTYARSTHSADVYNASGDPGYRDAISVRYYWIFESKVEGPWNQTKEDDAHGDVHAGTYWWTSENYSFNMNGKREGRYTITAKVDLTVKADLDGDGNPETQEGRNTKAVTRFEIE